MGQEVLANAALVSRIIKGNSVLVEVDGSVRRITFEDLISSINAGDQQLLSQVAWGVPIKQSVQSSPVWGMVGNTQMWNEFKDRIGRYLLTNDGKAAKLSKTNSGIYADGTTLDETKGHIMGIMPDRLYYRVVVDATTGIPYLWGSMIPIGGHHIDPIAVGAYLGSMSGSALTSRSGVKPVGSKTISAFWNAAQVNGKDFGIGNLDFRKVLIMLNLFEYGNPNVQTNIGYGVGGSSGKDLWSTASQLLTGATKSLGDSCGKIDISVVNGDIVGDDCSRVNLFGWEDTYNWLWEMIQGVYFGSSDNANQDGSEIFLYEGNRMPTSAELASHPNGEFRQLTRITSSGYVQEMILGEFFDIFAKKHGGGSTSYWCDYDYANTTGQLLLWGGNALYGTSAGLGCALSNYAFSDAASVIGARLAYYGPLTIVNGNEI